MQSDFIQNPHLEGDTFLWEGGPVGVLLFHGFTATTAEVRLLGETLHAAGYTISGPLLPGHGTTPQEMNRCRWQDWTRAAAQAYRQLAARCETVFVAGESMGGLLTLFLGSEYPEIAGLAVFAPALMIPSRVVPLVAPLLAPLMPLQKKAEGLVSAADARWKGYNVNPSRAAVQLFRLQRQVRSRLSRITQPILIVHGRLDETVHPAGPEIIHQQVSSAVKELRYLDHSGHCVILDQEWEQAAGRTLGFFQRVLEMEAES